VSKTCFCKRTENKKPQSGALLAFLEQHPPSGSRERQ
jgi:hypothetical protein